MERRELSDSSAAESATAGSGRTDPADQWVFDPAIGSGQTIADFVSKDGTRRPYVWTGQYLVHDGKAGYIGVALDMTEQEELRDDYAGVTVVDRAMQPYDAPLQEILQGITPLPARASRNGVGSGRPCRRHSLRARCAPTLKMPPQRRDQQKEYDREIGTLHRLHMV